MGKNVVSGETGLQQRTNDELDDHNPLFVASALLRTEILRAPRQSARAAGNAV
jgi:hypothetical protein